MSWLGSKVKIEIEWLGKEDFRIKFDSKAMDNLTVAKSRIPREERGGEARELLAASVAECMMSTLLFYLKWAKLEFDGLKTLVEIVTDKDDKGRYSVGAVNLNFVVDSANDEHALRKVERAKKMLDRGCFISRSLTRGIRVNYSIEIRKPTNRRP